MNAVGATEELSLRVSVATLVRVVFKHPKDGSLWLALERKATLHKGKHRPRIEVKSQPFGGAVRIRDVSALRDLIGDFHSDSERSRSERDLRIFIKPSDWAVVREMCKRRLSHPDDPILEGDPRRELSEEFADALKIDLQPDQYSSGPIASVVEDHPTPTENTRAEGHPTARVYRLFEAAILDPSLADLMMKNSEHYSDLDLLELVLEDARKGGKGRANAVLAFPMERLRDHYLATPPEERDALILFQGHRLDETAAVVLEGIEVPKYRRL